MFKTKESGIRIKHIYLNNTSYNVGYYVVCKWNLYSCAQHGTILCFPEKMCLRLPNTHTVYTVWGICFQHLTQPWGSSVPLVVSLDINGHSWGTGDSHLPIILLVQESVLLVTLCLLSPLVNVYIDKNLNSIHFDDIKMGVRHGAVVSTTATQSRVLFPWDQRDFCEFVCPHVCVGSFHVFLLLSTSQSHAFGEQVKNLPKSNLTCECHSQVNKIPVSCFGFMELSESKFL